MKKTSNKNILIIDDAASITMQVELLLQKSGYNTTVANTVDNGMEKIQEKNYDYVIIDLLIPNYEDGLKLLKNLKKHIKSCNINTKIIIMSASSKDIYWDECKEQGASYFIEKNKNWQETLLNTLK